MRYLVLIALLLMPVSARAVDWNWDWTTRDTVMETTFVGLVFLDWQQTRWGLYSQDGADYARRRYGMVFYETNPVLGKFPSEARLNWMVAGAVVGHVAVARLLPNPARFWWQATFIAVETNMVVTNGMLVGGLRFHF